MERVVSKEEVRQAVLAARREGKRVALIPTMGALHEGHLSLVRAACERADYVAVSIFVNPTQFGPGEDFEAYPRDLEHDMQLLKAEGADLLFTPTTASMYTADAQVEVTPGPLGELWEGAIRPGHFGGVCTVVSKLLNIVQPDLAFFGEKDFQQLTIIKRMVCDLDAAVRVVPCPIVRESDGLALSSRNAYLSPEERRAATALYRALRTAETLALGGERDIALLTEAMRACIAEEPLATLDYAAVVDLATLAEPATLDSPARAIIAVRLGNTRLIDNMQLTTGV